MLAYHTPTQTARYATRMIKTNHNYYQYAKTSIQMALEYQDTTLPPTK